jgi:hypothetical protein
MVLPKALEARAPWRTRREDKSFIFENLLLVAFVTRWKL